MADAFETMLQQGGDIDEMTAEEVGKNFGASEAPKADDAGNDEGEEKKNPDEGQEDEGKSKEGEKKEEKKDEKAPSPTPKAPEADKQEAPKGDDFTQSVETMSRLVEEDNELLVKLAKSSDPKEVALAKAVAEKVFGMSLQEALTDMGHEAPKALAELDIEERAQKLADEKFQKRVQEHAQKRFVESSEYINPSAANYNPDIAKKFTAYLEKLGGASFATEEEFTAHMEDAYYLASKDIREQAVKTKAEEEASIAAAKRIHASAGSGGTEKQKAPDTTTSFLDRFDDSD